MIDVIWVNHECPNGWRWVRKCLEKQFLAACAKPELKSEGDIKRGEAAFPPLGASLAWRTNACQRAAINYAPPGAESIDARFQVAAQPR